MIQGAVIHDLSAPATNTSLDEIGALQHCKTVTFRAISKGQLLAEPDLLRKFDVALFSSSFNPSRRRYEPQVLESIALFQGATLLTLQDEHGNVEAQREWIRLSRARVVITMAREPLLAELYPTEEFSNVHFVSALPGYVPERLEKIAAPPYHERSIDISYRGRYQGFGTGALGQDKHQVGEILRDGLAGSGLNLDIDPRGARRITGTRWDSLLQNSKAALAAESGSSLIDWDGSLGQQIHRYHQRHPRATFADIDSAVLGDRDWVHPYTTVSPRIFEYAANGCLLILTVGDHSNLLKPWSHYVPIKQDGSNLQEIASAVRDPTLWAEMTAKARKDLIDSGNYSWRTYAEKIDRALAVVGLSERQESRLVCNVAGSPLSDAIQLHESGSATKKIAPMKHLRAAVPKPLRTVSWGIRDSLRRNLDLFQAWVVAGIPWLLRHRSIALAREVSSIWQVRRGAIREGFPVPRLLITTSDSEGASTKFVGILQILSGYEVWELSNRKLHHLATTALERHDVLTDLGKLLHPIRVDVYSSGQHNPDADCAEQAPGAPSPRSSLRSNPRIRSLKPSVRTHQGRNGTAS